MQSEGDDESEEEAETSEEVINTSTRNESKELSTSVERVFRPRADDRRDE